MSVDESQLELVDRFLSDRMKVLDGPQPLWNLTGYGDYQMTWPILEEQTGFIRSHMRFRLPVSDYAHPSISLVFRNHNVCRVDRARPSACEQNPPYAQRLGLPPQVCGPHVHCWPDNRPHVALTGKWELPTRRPVEDTMVRLEHVFLWFCDHIAVRIQRDNKSLVLPDNDLFGGGSA